MRGFVADDLYGCFGEIEAIAKGTRCKQPLFSLSFNPPENGCAGIADFEVAIEQAEKKLGLSGQPRSIVFHEKNGRRHAHVVWSRIRADEMKAINHSHFKLKLKALSKQLYLDHGWELPNGHLHLGGASPDNFTLAQWQQAQRLGLDPREIKASFRDAWAQSDNRKSFAAALASKGYQLARGDRRGFVAVDIYGTVYSVPRWLSIKTKDVKSKLGSPELLPSVEDAQSKLRQKVTERLTQFIDQSEQRQQIELAPHKAGKRDRIIVHRQQRQDLKSRQNGRWAYETRARHERFNKGWRGLLDRLMGKARQLRIRNELDMRLCKARDNEECDALIVKQRSEVEAFRHKINALSSKHTVERKRLMRMVADFLSQPARTPLQPDQQPTIAM